MNKTFDIEELSAELGVDGHRKPVNTTETNRILRDFNLFKRGESQLAMTPVGGVHAVKSPDFKALEKTNPEVAQAMGQVGKEFRSF